MSGQWLGPESIAFIQSQRDLEDDEVEARAMNRAGDWLIAEEMDHAEVYARAIWQDPRPRRKWTPEERAASWYRPQVRKTP